MPRPYNNATMPKSIHLEKMQRDGIARLIALFVFAAVLVVGASSLLAAAPTGDSPANGLPITCQTTSLLPASTIWYKIPYHKGMELEINLTAIDGVYFDVFAPDQVKYWPNVGQPIGTSAPNRIDPVYLKTWQGHLEPSDYVLDYYYVRVTNLLGFQAIYQLCFQESASTLNEPIGDSPANGLTDASCVLQSLNPNAQIWHEVTYHTGYELELYLKTISTGVRFEVYTFEQIKDFPDLGQPIGRGTPNKNEPDYASSWQGHLPESDYYYVRVIDNSNVAVQYQLCWVERILEGLPPTPTMGPPTPTQEPRRGFPF